MITVAHFPKVWISASMENIFKTIHFLTGNQTKNKHFPFKCRQLLVCVLLCMFLELRSWGDHLKALLYFSCETGHKDSFEMPSCCWANVEILFTSSICMPKKEPGNTCAANIRNKKLNQHLKEELDNLEVGSATAEELAFHELHTLIVTNFARFIID